MNYDFTESEIALFTDIREKTDAMAETGGIESRDPGHCEARIRKAMDQLSQTPYLKLGLLPDEKYNGAASLMGAMEILAAASPSVYLSIEAGNRLFGRAVARWGSDTQRDKWLTPVLEGTAICALALSKASFGVENDPPNTVATRDNGAFRVTGEKPWVINAPVADRIAVAGLWEGVNALFILEKNHPGLHVGPSVATTAYPGTPVSGIRLENCMVPEEQVIFCAETEDMPQMLHLWENHAMIGASLGIAKTAFETARSHAKQHKSGGKPLIAYQAIGFKLAEMLTLLQTSQLLAFQTAWSLDNEPKQADELTLCAKVFCADAAQRISGEAMRILGRDGCLSGNPVENAYHCANYGHVAGTSTEIARIRIGDAALGWHRRKGTDK